MTFDTVGLKVLTCLQYINNIAIISSYIFICDNYTDNDL